MNIFTIIEWAVIVVLIGVTAFSVGGYRTLKRRWERLPVVVATVTQSSLEDHLNVAGGRDYLAKIRFSYEFGGSSYESDTPALRGPQLFPLWNYEAELLRKYKEGGTYNARVVPEAPETAYLEIAPLSRISVIVLPIITIGYVLYFLGLGLSVLDWFSLAD